MLWRFFKLPGKKEKDFSLKFFVILFTCQKLLMSFIMVDWLGIIEANSESVCDDVLSVFAKFDISCVFQNFCKLFLTRYSKL